MLVFIVLIRDFTNMMFVMLFVFPFLSCSFWALQCVLNPSLTSPYTWLINSYDLEQSGRDDIYTAPDVALRASLMSQPLSSPTAHKPSQLCVLKLPYQRVSTTKCFLIWILFPHSWVPCPPIIWNCFKTKGTFWNPPVIPSLTNRNQSFIAKNNTAKSSAYQLELCVLLPDAVLFDQRFCEDYLMSQSEDSHKHSKMTLCDLYLITFFFWTL